MIIIDVAWNHWHHMTSDSIDELHSFAKELGLKREWFQDKHQHPHYDLKEGKAPIKKALKQGVKLVSKREYLMFVIKHHRHESK